MRYVAFGSGGLHPAVEAQNLVGMRRKLLAYFYHMATGVLATLFVQFSILSTKQNKWRWGYKELH